MSTYQITLDSVYGLLEVECGWSNESPCVSGMQLAGDGAELAKELWHGTSIEKRAIKRFETIIADMAEDYHERQYYR